MGTVEFGLLFESIVPMIIIFYLGVMNLDPHCLLELLLPRLWGVILIGYVAFFISQDSWSCQSYSAIELKMILPMPFCHALKAAQWLHVGKGTSYGFGAMAVQY